MTTKLEQAARQSFETWWESEGQEFLYALNTTTDDDIKLVAEVAWKNGAYCAEQAEHEPIEGVLPCPFCGCTNVSVNEGSTFRWRYAMCDNCGAQAGEVRFDTLAAHTETAEKQAHKEAIEEWNNRAAPVRTKDLTDDEIDEIFEVNRTVGRLFRRDFARAVIAADRRKNK